MLRRTKDPAPLVPLNEPLSDPIDDTSIAPGPTAGGRMTSLWPNNLSAQIVDRLANAAMKPLDRAFDQVFEHNLDVRSVDHGVELVSAMAMREKANTRIGTWVALAASLRPLALRMAKQARRASTAAKFTGPGRVAAWGITGTIAATRMVESAQMGVSELQVMAAFLAHRVRERGQRPSREAVEAAVLALYVKPGRKPDLSRPRRQAVSAVARRWAFDAFRSLSDDARSRRARQRLLGVADLPDKVLLQLVDVIPATLTPPAPLERRVQSS